MVAVEMGNADGAQPSDCHPGQDALSLAALTRIEQHELVVPPKDIPIVGPKPSRRLTGGAENHQFAGAHADGVYG